jgi:hypothetical protein
LIFSNICTDGVGFGYGHKLIILLINRTTWRLIKLFLINVTDGLKSNRYYSKMANTPWSRDKYDIIWWYTIILNDLWSESNHFRLPEKKCKAALYGNFNPFESFLWNNWMDKSRASSFVHELKCNIDFISQGQIFTNNAYALILTCSSLNGLIRISD